MDKELKEKINNLALDFSSLKSLIKILNILIYDYNDAENLPEIMTLCTVILRLAKDFSYDLGKIEKELMI